MQYPAQILFGNIGLWLDSSQSVATGPRSQRRSWYSLQCVYLHEWDQWWSLLESPLWMSRQAKSELKKVECKLTCPDALPTLIFFNSWLGLGRLETPSKDELLSGRLEVMEKRRKVFSIMPSTRDIGPLILPRGIPQKFWPDPYQGVPAKFCPNCWVWHLLLSL